MAIEYRTRKQYQWILHYWKIYTDNQYCHREQKIKASQFYKKHLLKRNFSHWNRQLEKQFLEGKNLFKVTVNMLLID